jgi:hypothetical protein
VVAKKAILQHKDIALRLPIWSGSRIHLFFFIYSLAMSSGRMSFNINDVKNLKENSFSYVSLLLLAVKKASNWQVIYLIGLLPELR